MDPSLSLADRIEEWARRAPAAPAFLAPHDTLGWADYDERSQRLARAITASGIQPAERVAVWLPDGPGVHVAFVAGEKAGTPILGIGPRAGIDEVRHLLETTRAVALVSRATHRDVDTRSLFTELQRQGLPLRTHFVVEGEIAADAVIVANGCRSESWG